MMMRVWVIVTMMMRMLRVRVIVLMEKGKISKRYLLAFDLFLLKKCTI